MYVCGKAAQLVAGKHYYECTATDVVHEAQTGGRTSTEKWLRVYPHAAYASLAPLWFVDAESEATLLEPSL